MRILVINSGSSSIKFSVFDSGPAGSASEPHLLLDGELSGIGGPDASLNLRRSDTADPANQKSNVQIRTPVEALALVLNAVTQSQTPSIDAVGYRVVHPGAKLGRHQRITPEVVADMEAAAVFAPLHDPAVITIIREGMARFPGIAHYACFDTVFHQTMPEEASTYPIPREYREQGARRYGFHGLSCESIVRQLRTEAIEFPKRLAIAHLGSGCSVTALIDGRSVDTSMGLTPTGGIVMGARPGDLDPGLVLYFLRQQKTEAKDAIAAVEAMLNRASGMVALSGMENDMKAVRAAAIAGDVQAQLAVKVFTRSVTKAIGGFCWLMRALDAIVFSGGIGEHDAATRTEILSNLQGLGIAIDASLNEGSGSGIRRINASDSETAVFVVPAQENLMIAVHVDQMARSGI